MVSPRWHLAHRDARRCQADERETRRFALPSPTVLVGNWRSDRPKTSSSFHSEVTDRGRFSQQRWKNRVAKNKLPSRHHSTVHALLRPQTPLVPLTAISAPGTATPVSLGIRAAERVNLRGNSRP